MNCFEFWLYTPCKYKHTHRAVVLYNTVALYTWPCVVYVCVCV